MSALKRSEIIDLAIQQAGSDTGITLLAEKWLDNILDRLYEDHKWPFQEKSTSGSLAVGATSVSLPSDYLDVWNKYGLRLEDANGQRIPLLIRDNDYLDLVADVNVRGTPEVAVIDLATMTWRPYPLPATPYTWRLRYKYKPQRLKDVGVSDPIPVFPNDQLLVEALFTVIMQYEDDDRVVQDMAFLDTMVRRYKHGFNKSVAKSDTMKLSPEVFKTIFPLR